MTDFDDELKEKMRTYLAKEGQKVEFRKNHFGWGDDDEVSSYGWSDYGAWEHINKGCTWVIPEGTVVKELTYSMFDGTFTNNKDEVGLNAEGCHCKCGTYKNVTIRVVSSLGDAIRGVLGYNPTTQLEL